MNMNTNNNGKFEVTHEMILRELYKIAFANMGNYYDDNAVLKPINQLSDDEKAAISQYQLIDCIGDYQERAGELSKIKLHNKLSALDKIARHVGFYLKKSESRRSESREVRVEESESRRSESPEVRREAESPEVLSGEVESLEPGLVGAKNKEQGERTENNLTIAPFLSSYVISKRGTSEKSSRSDIVDMHVGDLAIAEDFSSLSLIRNDRWVR
jgi:hypothetical protein